LINLAKSKSASVDSIHREINEINGHLESLRAIYLDKNAVSLPPDQEIMVYWKSVLGNKATHGL